jgi:hypothetical protein
VRVKKFPSSRFVRLNDRPAVDFLQIRTVRPTIRRDRALKLRFTQKSVRLEKSPRIKV